MAKYAKKLSVGISLFLCSTNCMLLNTVHRGRWEYIARSIIDIIIIIIVIIIIVGVIINIIIGCYNTCYHLDVIMMYFWQEQWLITYSQTAASAVWLVVVHDGRRSQERVPVFTPVRMEFLSSVDSLLYLQRLFLNLSSLHPLKAECPPGCKSGWRMLA